MTYTASGGALDSTHLCTVASFGKSLKLCFPWNWPRR